MPTVQQLVIASAAAAVVAVLVVLLMHVFDLGEYSLVAAGVSGCLASLGTMEALCSAAKRDAAAG